MASFTDSAAAGRAWSPVLGKSFIVVTAPPHARRYAGSPQKFLNARKIAIRSPTRNIRSFVAYPPRSSKQRNEKSNEKETGHEGTVFGVGSLGVRVRAWNRGPPRGPRRSRLRPRR